MLLVSKNQDGAGRNALDFKTAVHKLMEGKIARQQVENKMSFRTVNTHGKERKNWVLIIFTRLYINIIPGFRLLRP